MVGANHGANIFFQNSQDHSRGPYFNGVLSTNPPTRTIWCISIVNLELHKATFPMVHVDYKRQDLKIQICV
jgi:hypothetical protein